MPDANLATLLAACLLSAGQPNPPAKGPDPATDPMLTNPALEDHNPALAPPAPAKPVAPTPGEPTQRPVPAVPPPGEIKPSPQVPGVVVPSAPTRGRFYPEGTFLSSRRGIVVGTTGGESIFVPAGVLSQDASADERDAPMVILRNQRLKNLLDATASASEPPQVVVSGQVYVYRDRPYLLLSAISVAPLAARPTPTNAPTNPEANKPEALANPKVQSLIADLERRRTDDRALPGAKDRKAQDTKSSVLPEGTTLTQRRGRIVRSGAGAAGGGEAELLVAFDNDPNSPSLAPMALLPCRMSEQMENLASQRGESLVVKVSGRLTTFDGRNYLIPTLFTVQRTEGIVPLQ